MLTTARKHGIARLTLHFLLGTILFLQMVRPCMASELSHLIENGGYIVRNHNAVLKFRDQDTFIPASTLKILTSLVALNRLGPQYRFETDFFLDDRQNLYIKGFGDPFLTSEVLLDIGHTLRKMGIRQLAAIYLDTSSFALNGEMADNENSANPYDAPNGALAVNFNALPFEIGRDGRIGSGEPQTPVIPLMQEAAARLAPGRYRINVNTLPAAGRLTPVERYAGELLVVLFRQAGIAVPGYNIGTVPPNLQPYYVHHGEKTLAEIIRACLKNSNNFIANQLFLACGVDAYGLPATWEKSRRTFTGFLQQQLHLGAGSIHIKEGSGLSRQNRVTPAAFIAILDNFKPYSGLLKHENNILLKSGTMKEVYCYAGYFPQGSELTPFAILLNQPQNKRYRVLQILRNEIEKTNRR